jgi:hypothetical protein
MEEEKTEIFLDGIDENNITTEIQRHINAIYSYSTQLVNFKYFLLLYRIVKKGYMTMDQITEVTGLKSNRVYKVINDFEKRELKRQGIT